MRTVEDFIKEISVRFNQPILLNSFIDGVEILLEEEEIALFVPNGMLEKGIDVIVKDLITQYEYIINSLKPLPYDNMITP